MPTCPNCGRASVRRSRHHVRPGTLKRPFALWLRCNVCGCRFPGTDWRRASRWAVLAGVLGGLLGVFAWAGGETPPERWVLASRIRALDDVPLSASSLPPESGTLAAARRGDREAQCQLGLARLREYREQGFRTSLQEAVEWLRQAAEQGDPRAQFEMGNLHESGSGVLQDFAEAARWFHEAAGRGHAEAMFCYGRMVGQGRGLQRNLVEAYAWLNVAAARGEARAELARDRVAALLSNAELAAAQERSRQLNAEMTDTM